MQHRFGEFLYDHTLQDVDGNNVASTFVEDVRDGDELFIYGTGDALGVTVVAEKLIAGACEEIDSSIFE